MKEFLTEQVRQLMGWAVPDPLECRQAAMAMIARAPGASREQLARELVRDAQKRAAAIGGLTGAAAGPWALVPAALADTAAVLKIEGTMVGGVAALLDPDSLDDAERFRADVVAVVFPAAVSQAIRHLGVRAGEQLTKNLVRRSAEKGGLETLLKLAGKVLGARLPTKALITKSVPLIGIGIGAGWNWLEASAVGRRAIAYHTGQPIAEDRLKTIGKKLNPAKLLPERWRRGGGAGERDDRHG